MPSYQESTRPAADASDASSSCMRDGSIIIPASAIAPSVAAGSSPRRSQTYTPSTTSSASIVPRESVR